MRKSDAALLERWVSAKDPEAFSEIVCRHAGMVYTTCRRVLGNAAEAEDATQDCFLQLSQASRTDIRCVGGWLHSAATHRAMDRLKTNSRRTAREIRYAQEQPAAAGPEWNDIQPHVDEIIAQLDDDLRTPLVLHFFEGRTHRETAKALGVSRSTVTNRIQRAIQQIREQLDARGVTLAAATLTTLLETAEANAAPSSLLASLNKFALAAGRPTPRPHRNLKWRYAALPAAVVLIAISMIAFRESITSPTERNTTNAESTTMAANIPSAASTATTAVPADQPDETRTVLAQAVEESASNPPPLENPLRLHCVDRNGDPVPGAEVYYVRGKNHTPPMTWQDSDDDFTQEPYGPVISDAAGVAQVPNIEDLSDPSDRSDLPYEYYMAYARVPGKLVGVWNHSPRAKTRDGWDEILLVPSTTVSGAVSVPPGYDPTQVTVDLLTLLIAKGDIRFRSSFSASSKYMPSLWPEVFSTTPNSDGNFQMPDMPVRQSTYFAFAAPGLGETQFFTSDTNDEPISVTMHPEAVIRGSVRRSNGAPVPDVPVFARPFGGRNSGIGVTTPFRSHTDAFGRYEIKGLPRGVYAVKVQHYGEPTEAISGVIPNFAVQPGTTHDNVDIVVEDGVLQEGVVLEKETKRPIPGVRIVAMNPGDVDNISRAESIGTSETGEDGKFAIRLPSGVSYLYFFSLPEEYTRPGQQGRTFVTVQPGEISVPPLTFTLAKKSEEELRPVGDATLTGRVIDASGAALSGVPIMLGWKFKLGNDERQVGTRSGATNDDGTFSAKVSAMGEHQLVVGGGRFSRVESEWFTVEENETKSFPDIVVEEYLHTVTVKVLNFDESPESYPPQAYLMVKETREYIGDGRLDHAGRAEIYVPNQPLVLHVQREGYQPVKIDAVPGFEYEVELVRESPNE